MRPGSTHRSAYGLRVAGGGLLEPFGGYGQRGGLGRRLQVGARLGTLGEGPGSLDAPVQLEISGERYERPGSPSDHRFSMLGVVSFGAERPSRPTESVAMEPGAAPAVLPDTVAVPGVVALPGAEAGGDSVTAVPVHDVGPPAVEPPDVAVDRSEEPVAVLAAADAVDPPGEPVAVLAAADAVDPVARVRVQSEPAPVTPTTRGAAVPRPLAATAAPAPRAVSAAPAPRAVSAVPTDKQGNRAPAFSQRSYAFEMPARLGGGVGVTELGAVVARDPDHDPLTYALAAGDWRRFRVEPMSGAINWVGSPRELAAGPRRYQLTVTARDTGRLVAAATVVVAVAPADPPARARRERARAAVGVAPADRPAGSRPERSRAVVAAVDRTPAPVREVWAALEARAEMREDTPVRTSVQADTASRAVKSQAARLPADRQAAHEARAGEPQRPGKGRRPPLRRVRLHNRH